MAVTGMGWHERGYLPHRDEPGLVQMITFRLADSFPAALRGEWEHLLTIENRRSRRTKLEAYLDQSRGACHLRNPKVAAIADDAVRFHHGKKYELLAWVVMANHVHVLFVTMDKPLGQVVGELKSFTAKEANRVLQRSGKLWADDYWDTYMRTEEHQRKAARYIENNPTKARLVLDPKDWPWSSARWRDDYGRLKL